MSHIEDIIIRHIANPEADTLRRQEIERAKAGTLVNVGCPHPLTAISQFADEEAGREGRPTNLFQCDVCRALLFLVDAHGQTASDG